MIGPTEMQDLYLHQYLGILKTIEENSAGLSELTE